MNEEFGGSAHGGESSAEKIARIDTTLTIFKEQNDKNATEIKNRIDNIASTMVSPVAFGIVQKLVFGTVTVILLAFITFFVNQAIHGPVGVPARTPQPVIVNVIVPTASPSTGGKP